MSIDVSDERPLCRETAADGKATEDEKNDDGDEHHQEVDESATTGLATERSRAPVGGLAGSTQRTSVTLLSNRSGE